MFACNVVSHCCDDKLIFFVLQQMFQEYLFVRLHPVLFSVLS